MGDYADAVTDLKRAIGLDSTVADWYLELGVNYELLNRKEEAKAMYRMVTREVFPSSAETMERARWRIKELESGK